MERIESIDGLFHEGNPSSGQKGTKVKATWLNAIQEEIAGVIEGAGEEVDAAQSAQLFKALRSGKLHDVLYASQFPSLALADAAAVAANQLLIISTIWAVVPATLSASISMLPGGRLNGNGTVAINGDFQGASGCFGVNQSVTNLVVSRPEWWISGGSAAFASAVNSLLPGGVVKLFSRAYRSPYTTEGTHLTKPNITFQGAKMPSVNAGKTALENGTVIQGPFCIYADYIKVENLGIDSGLDVCNAYFGGVSQEGLIVANLSSHPAAVSPFKGYRAKSVRVLLKDMEPTTQNHAFLCEYVDGPIVEDIHTQFGLHGIVFKALNALGVGLYAKDHFGDGVIIKSDDYALSGGSRYYGIDISSTVQGAGAGLVLFAASSNLGHIVVESPRISNTSFGVLVNGIAPNSAEDITINSPTVLNTTGFGYQFSATANYVTVNDGVANSGQNTGFFVEAGATNIKLNGCRARNNAVRGFHIFSVSTKLIGCSTALNGLGGLHVATPALNMERCDFPDGITSEPGGRINSADISNIVYPNLLNNWVNFGGSNSVAAHWLDNGKLRFSGLIKSGVIGQPIMTIPELFWPVAVKRFHVLCFNGETVVTGEIIIGTDGGVALSYGANGYVSLDGLELSLTYD